MFLAYNPSTDPAFNLALEEVLMQQYESTEPLFMLWQNDNTIVIGRHQDAYQEINFPLAEKKGVHLVRRNTGGGAVYHDLGNINFSIIQKIPHSHLTFDLSKALQPIIEALHELGIPVELSGRNDLLLEGKKVSGCAFTNAGGKFLCHGTLLYDTDFSLMDALLTPTSEKLTTKGVASVRSRVGNLKAYLKKEGRDTPSVETFMEKLLITVCKNGDKKRLKLDEKYIEISKSFAQDKYRNKEWTLGKNPGGNLVRKKRYPYGEITLYMRTKGERIEEIEFTGDFFSRSDLSGLKSLLLNCPLTVEELMNRLPSSLDHYISGMKQEELIQLILGADQC